MNTATKRKWGFTAALVGVPAVANTLHAGSYLVDPYGTFWIGPIGTTLPFVFLALLFWAHCGRSERSKRVKSGAVFPCSATMGAGAAWLAMQGFTQFLLSHPAGPQVSSTQAIAVVLTPLCYLPLLVVGYITGILTNRVRGAWSQRAINDTTHFSM